MKKLMVMAGLIAVSTSNASAGHPYRCQIFKNESEGRKRVQNLYISENQSESGIVDVSDDPDENHELHLGVFLKRVSGGMTVQFRGVEGSVVRFVVGSLTGFTAGAAIRDDDGRVVRGITTRSARTSLATFRISVEGLRSADFEINCTAINDEIAVHYPASSSGPAAGSYSNVAR